MRGARMPGGSPPSLPDNRSGRRPPRHPRAGSLRPSRSQAAGECAELQPPADPDGREADALFHLGFAGVAIDEDDRDLVQTVAAAPGAEVHLDLEGVPVRAHAVEIDPGERVAAPTLEAAGGVADRDAR